jgi:nitroreductase
MMTRRQANIGLANIGLLAAASVVPAEKSTASEARIKQLPPARTAGGKPLLEALQLRRSIREYADRPIEPQMLSDLLWSAYGINRPTGDRTAPYWRHVMVIDLFAVMADGTWLYDPQRHALVQHLEDDLRAKTGVQDFAATAPLNLVYVAHGERMTDVSTEDRRLFASADACFIGQNVYLFCASEGLATVFRGAVDLEALRQAMHLGPDQFVTFAQTVGYPKHTG